MIPTTRPVASLPAMLFPTVGWFIEACRQGRVNVATGGLFDKKRRPNRFAIVTASGIQQITVPVIHTGASKNLVNTRVFHSGRWSKEQITTLRSSYGKAPFYEFYDYRILPLWEEQPEMLIDWIQRGIVFLHRYLTPDLPLAFVNELAATLEYPFVPDYPQVFDTNHSFTQPVSALDLLFNLGPEAPEYLKMAAVMK